MSKPIVDGPAATDSREQLLSATFVLLADTLVDDYDVLDLLDQLVTACTNLLGVATAGLLLDDQKGELAVVASSTEQTRVLDLLQVQTNEGPCLDCLKLGTAVSSADLQADSGRWPQFAPAALAAGYQSVVAVPLRLRNQTIGGLNLFCNVKAPMSVADQRLAQALADVATIGILQRRSTDHNAVVAGQLQHALDSRVVIEQAKGVLAERRGVSMDAAFDVLRRHARSNNLKLTEVAQAVVLGDVDLSSARYRPSKG